MEANGGAPYLDDIDSSFGYLNIVRKDPAKFD